MEPIWTELYNNTNAPSPYSSPDVMRILWKYLLPYYITSFRRPEIILIKTTDDRAIFAAAFLVPICKSGKLELLADINGIALCSPIYTPDAPLDECFKMIRSHYGKDIYFARVSDSAIFLKHTTEIKSHTACVAIDFSNGYEYWRQSLTKSIRQNLRTSYNRLKTDGKEYNLLPITTPKEFRMHIKEIIRIYADRHKVRYGLSTPTWKKYFLRNLNFATKIFEKAENSKTFLFTIDNEPASFMSGIVSKNGRLTVPRLSIDSKFRRYSPGALLINETIQYLYKTSTATILDLSIGEEQYKYDMGGQKYLQISGIL